MGFEDILQKKGPSQKLMLVSLRIEKFGNLWAIALPILLNKCIGEKSYSIWSISSCLSLLYNSRLINTYKHVQAYCTSASLVQDTELFWAQMQIFLEEKKQIMIFFNLKKIMLMTKLIRW